MIFPIVEVARVDGRIAPRANGRFLGSYDDHASKVFYGAMFRFNRSLPRGASLHDPDAWPDT